MASPKLKHGYVVVDPKDTKDAERFAFTIKGIFNKEKLWALMKFQRQT